MLTQYVFNYLYFIVFLYESVTNHNLVHLTVKEKCLFIDLITRLVTGSALVTCSMSVHRTNVSFAIIERLFTLLVTFNQFNQR